MNASWGNNDNDWYTGGYAISIRWGGVCVKKINFPFPSDKQLAN